MPSIRARVCCVVRAEAAKRSSQARWVRSRKVWRKARKAGGKAEWWGVRRDVCGFVGDGGGVEVEVGLKGGGGGCGGCAGVSVPGCRARMRVARSCGMESVCWEFPAAAKLAVVGTGSAGGVYCAMTQYVCGRAWLSRSPTW